MIICVAYSKLSCDNARDSSSMWLLQPAAKVFYGIYKQSVSTQRLATRAHRCCAVKRQVNWIKPHLREKKETEYVRLIYSLYRRYTPENIYFLEEAKNTYTSWINVCEETLQKLKRQMAKQMSQCFGNVEYEPLWFQFMRCDCVHIKTILNKDK